MGNRKVHVYIEIEGKLHLVGQLWARSDYDKEGASFQYDQSWLSHPERFAIEPALNF
jgi:serine/threonine-protein kinase HipA